MIIGLIRNGMACLLVLIAAGCQRSVPAPPRAASPPKAVPFTTSFTARNWSFHLRRVGADEDEKKAAAIWRDLFAGIAEDPKTKDLLRRLHGGRPVQFVVLDARQADATALAAAPPDGYDFAMRLADLKPPGQPGGERVRVVAYGHATNLKDAMAPTMPDIADTVKVMKTLPAGEPLELALEEYVVRHAPGWVLIGGPYFREKPPPPSIEEYRRDLESRIREHESRAAAYYGSPETRH